VKIIINFIFFNNDNYLPKYLGGTITKISIKEIKNIQYAFFKKKLLNQHIKESINKNKCMKL